MDPIVEFLACIPLGLTLGLVAAWCCRVVYRLWTVDDERESEWRRRFPTWADIEEDR